MVKHSGTLALLLVAVLLMGCSSSSTGGSSGSASGPGIGDPVSDGQFTFTVKSVKCGVTSVGGGMLKTQAQGEFCDVNLTVKNTGQESQTLDSSSQYLFIGDKKYETSSDTIFNDKSRTPS